MNWLREEGFTSIFRKTWFIDSDGAIRLPQWAKISGVFWSVRPFGAGMAPRPNTVVENTGVKISLKTTIVGALPISLGLLMAKLLGTLFLWKRMKNYRIMDLNVNAVHTITRKAYFFNGFTSNSNSCTANDRNRMIQMSSKWRLLRKCNQYFIHPQ